MTEDANEDPSKSPRRAIQTSKAPDRKCRFILRQGVVMTIDLYRTQAERDREDAQRVAESEERRDRCAAEYHRAVRNLCIAVFVVIFIGGVFLLSPKAASADAAYQSYSIEQVAR